MNKMEEVTLENPFINRRNESEYIKELVTQRNRVNIIFSTKGTGKTCLIDYVISKINKEMYVNINTSELLSQVTPEYYFISKIISSIIKKLNINSLTNKTLQVFNEHMSNLSISINLGPLGVGYTLPQSYKKSVDMLIEKINSIDEDFYIHIENSQKIDSSSLSYIIRIINETKNTLFFLECSNDIEFCENIAQTLKRNMLDVDILSISKLDWTHARIVLENLNILITDTIENDYNYLKGNIKEIIFNNKHVLARNIVLDSEQQFCLDFINIVSSDLSINEVHNVLVKYNIANKYLYSLPNLREYTNELLHLELVAENNAEHYYITNLGQLYTKASNIDLIIAILANYYIPIIEKNIKVTEDKIRGLRLLIRIFIKYNDKRIHKIIPYIEPNLLFINGNKDTIDEVYKCIISDISAETQISLLHIARSYIRLECFQEAYNILNEDFIDRSSTHTILYATTLIHLFPEKKETEQFIKDNLNISADFMLNSALYTCLMSLYMKIRPTAYVLSFIETLNTDKLTKTDYHIIQKNLSIYLDTKEAITTLRNCLKYFKYKKFNSLMIATAITLATKYAQNGFNEKAKKMLYELSDNSFLRIQDLTYIENNLAVLEIMDNKATRKTIEKLKAAYCFCKDEYTHLLIANNILIYYIHSNQFTEAVLYANEIENVGFDLYKFDDYLHLANLNLRYYYTAIANEEKVVYYNNQLRELQKKCHSKKLQLYISATLGDTIISDKSDRWFCMSKLKYRPAFLGHWIVNCFDC